MHTSETLSRHPVDILIAEDDPQTREILQHLLEKEGFSCAVAENGRQAVEMARTSPPRCVLLDLAMPGLDGFAVARKLRADPRTRTTHIHCLTGREDSASRREARQAGCEAYLTKPVNVRLLLQVIHQQMTGPQEVWVSGLSKTEAEDLLDWLETHGGRGEVCYQDEGDFAVQCRGSLTFPAPPTSRELP
jgi:CheY-like chemotaxis protein